MFGAEHVRCALVFGGQRLAQFFTEISPHGRREAEAALARVDAHQIEFAGQSGGIVIGQVPGQREALKQDTGRTVGEGVSQHRRGVSSRGEAQGLESGRRALVSRRRKDVEHPAAAERAAGRGVAQDEAVADDTA